MTKKLLVTVCITVLAVAAAGCGGNDEGSTTTTEATPASDWAEGFCTAVTTWKDSVKGVTDQFTDLSSFSEEGLQNAVSDVQDATDTFIGDLKVLGTPDTQSGEDVKSSIDGLATTLEDELTSIQTTVDNTSGITEIPGAVKDISASVTTMSTQFSSTLTTIEDADVQGELKTAIQDSPTCADIVG